MNTRKFGVDDSEGERHDIASINQFDAVSDGAHRDVDPVVPRIEPLVPRVESVDVSGTPVRPTVPLEKSTQTIRKPHPPEKPVDPFLRNEVLFAAPKSDGNTKTNGNGGGNGASNARPEPKRPAVKADDHDKSRMADEGGFDPPAWEARTTTQVKSRGLDHRARVIAIRVLERLEREIHALVVRLSGPEADPSGAPSLKH
jgi:hypothetical protein